MDNTEITKTEIEAFHKRVGKNVKRVRKQKGVSQLKLASLIGHDSVAHVAKAELNKYDKRFNLEHIYRISKALDVGMDEFFKDVEE